MTASETIYEPLPPPETPVDPAALPPNLKLTDAQQKLYDELLKHFSSADYALPDVEGGALTEEEKFWLVRSGRLARRRGADVVAVLGRAPSVC